MVPVVAAYAQVLPPARPRARESWLSIDGRRVELVLPDGCARALDEGYTVCSVPIPDFDSGPPEEGWRSGYSKKTEAKFLLNNSWVWLQNVEEWGQPPLSSDYRTEDWARLLDLGVTERTWQRVDVPGGGSELLSLLDEGYADGLRLYADPLIRKGMWTLTFSSSGRRGGTLILGKVLDSSWLVVVPHIDETLVVYRRTWDDLRDELFAACPGFEVPPDARFRDFPTLVMDYGVYCRDHPVPVEPALPVAIPREPAG